jgi:hypothetical protein
VRTGVDVADDVDGGGVGLFRRPPVRVRKAVKRAWVEERRSGVRGTLSDGGDIRLGVADRVVARRNRKQARVYRVRGSRRGEQQWRARIESIMGAPGRQRQRRRQSRVLGAHVRCRKGRAEQEGALGVRGLCVQSAHGDGVIAAEKLVSSSEGGSTGREPQKIARLG